MVNSYNMLIAIHFDIIYYLKFITNLLNMQRYQHFIDGEHFQSHIHLKIIQREKAKI